MATQKSTKKEKNPKEKKEIKWIQNLRATIKNETIQFVTGLLCVMIALYMILAFSSFILNGGTDQSAIEPQSVAEQIANPTPEEVQNATGRNGAHIAQLLINSSFGVPAYSIAAFLLVLGLNLMRTYKFNLKHWAICCATTLIWGSLFLSITIDRWFTGSAIYWGGYHGHNATAWLDRQFGMPGIIILLAVTAILFSMYLTSNTIEFIRSLFHIKSLLPGKEEEEGDQAISPNEKEDSNNTEVDFTIEEQPTEIEWDTDKKSEEQEMSDCEQIGMEIINTVTDTEEPQTGTQEEKPNTSIPEADFTIEINEEEKAEKIIEPYNPRLDLSRYKYPTIDLLNKGNDDAFLIDRDEQNAKKDSIIQALRNFGIEISSIKATVGPTITLYEITPAPGVRISKIKNLEDDIALTLAAFSTRIIAPIPGKGTIGIEIPNANPQVVSMHSVINSRKFQECNYELPVAIGKTITNEILMFDLCKMPHLLVAGATGQGKSVGLNAIITSLLYKKHPAELKLVMVDPKKVELSIYSSIEKHFLAKLPDGEDAIITDVTKVVQTLKSLCIEMDTRYDLLKAAGVRNLREYNERFINRQLNPEKGHKYMPYIVVIIDEFGDLIMTAGKEVELPIARIAQLARAVGIHMIIATQRPTTNIITGTIKANFPARIAFRVSSMIDSRTILDRPGANQLIGKGDMLFLQGSDPVRVQCAFVDTPEVERIGNYISEQQGYPTAFYLPEYVDENSADGSNLDDVDLKRLDPMFEDAARLVIVHQSGSTSLIQRKFSIGYNRAGRIMDQLEKAGIVGPVDGSKPRQVLCADEMDLEMKLNNLNS